MFDLSWLFRLFQTYGSDPSDSPEPDNASSGLFDPFDGGIVIPVGRKECFETFGDPGVTHDRKGRAFVSRSWERRNLGIARIDGIPRGKIYIHRKVEPYLREAIRRANKSCPGYCIETLGCFNPRHQRHNRRRPLSYHTWAVAVDINHRNNMPGTDGDMPDDFVRSFISVGWEWGGSWRWRDPMHFQLVITHNKK